MSLRAVLAAPAQHLRHACAAVWWSASDATALFKRRLASDGLVPKEIKLKQGGKRLDVLFADGSQVSLPAEYLRVMSPSADALKKDASGQTRVVSGRRHVGILGVEPVGNYAIRLKFDDLHQAGIFSWELLHDLGSNKWHHMRRYLSQLRARGLTRDPRPRKKSSSGLIAHDHHHPGDDKPCSSAH